MVCSVWSDLHDKVRQLPGLWFGVVDGAQVSNVVSALEQTGLRHQPLYIGLNDKLELLKTAPFMVWLNRENDTAESLPDEQRMRQFHHIVAEGKLSAAVLWKCNAGSDVLYRHLRSLNKVIIPQEKDGVISAQKSETVVFRHADANVLCQVLPVLPMKELSRVLGAADYMTFGGDREWAETTYNVSAGPALPEPDKGFLQISAETYRAIKQKRADKAKRDLAKKLKESLPECYGSYDTEQMNAVVDKYYHSGRQTGLETKRGLYQWTYLMHASNDLFIEQHMIRDYLTAPSAESVDERLDTLFAAMVLTYEKGREA